MKKEKEFLVNTPLACEFDMENNSGVRLEELAEHSGKKVNWRCIKGHMWSATVDSRSKGSGCPYCAGKKVIPGETDLKTINPELAKEFDVERNPEIRLEELTGHSGRKVNWKCKNGHMWAATVDNRSKGRGCPYCAGKKVIPGETDLKTVNPELAEEFDIENNFEVRLDELAEYSNKKVNWRCKKGHMWSATVANRSNGKGCPFCAGKKAIIGETDLKTIKLIFFIFIHFCRFHLFICFLHF